MECPHCGNSSIDEDGQHIPGCLICHSCGAVIEEGVLTAADTAGTSYAFKDRVVIHPVKRNVTMRALSEGLKGGLEAIAVLSSQLNVPSALAEASRDLYKRALREPTIKKIPVAKKIWMATACVYVALRRASIPISIVNVCQSYRFTLDQFSTGYSLLVRAANLQTKQPPIEDIVEGLLGELDLGDERSATTLLTSRVINLCTELWLTTGRSNRPTILACAYVAWKYLHRSDSATTYKAFCFRTKTACSRVVNMRISEVQKMLVELGQKLPWLQKKELRVSTISMHLQDILKYSNALRVDASCAADVGLKRDMEVDEFCRFRSQRLKKRPKRCQDVNDHEPQADQEIDDKDIDQYIRSEREVLFISGIHKKYQETAE